VENAVVRISYHRDLNHKYNTRFGQNTEFSAVIPDSGIRRDSDCLISPLPVGKTGGVIIDFAKKEVNWTLVLAHSVQ
jgi:hypothetical protein